MLVAERDGRILAALALDDGRAIADPFAPTADSSPCCACALPTPARSFPGAGTSSGVWVRAPGGVPRSRAGS